MNVQDRLTIQKQSSLFLVCHKLLSTRLLIKVCTIISILLLLYWLFYNYNETFDFHKDLLFQKTTFLMLKISTLGQNFPRIGDISKRIIERPYYYAVQNWQLSTKRHSNDCKGQGNSP